MPDATKIWEGWEAFQRLHGWTPYAYHRRTKTWWRYKTGTMRSVGVRTPEEACEKDRKLLADGEHVALPVLWNCYSCKHSDDRNDPRGCALLSDNDAVKEWLYTDPLALRGGGDLLVNRLADNCPGHEWASNVLGGDHE